MSSDSNGNVQEYRHDAKRKNNPPAGLASQSPSSNSEKLHYRFDPHLPPKLRFDQTGEADELPKGLPELLQKAVTDGLTEEEAEIIAAALRRRQQPWLEWTGKRQKHDVEVNPTALHTHERVSAKAIINALGRREVQRDLFADPRLPIQEAVQFYQHDVDWTNRLILGDSLEVMSSLAHREDLAGQVQMIYLDPPYGINYRSNFQPTVAEKSYSETYSNLSREPETVKAYRDTWKLGIHSYLDYLRDRLVLCRELLKDEGSIFVQISDENVHTVRNILDEVFGADNFVRLICLGKTGGLESKFVNTVFDYILWYSKSLENIKYRPLYTEKKVGDPGATKYTRIEEPTGEIRSASKLEVSSGQSGSEGAKFWTDDNLTSQGNARYDFNWRGETYEAPWKTPKKGLERLDKAGRLYQASSSIRYKRYLADFPINSLTNDWDDIGGIQSRSDPKVYVVQTAREAIKRCMLMTSDPGDLILDPTCGSGTTAYVAEQWGRRWITVDTSRVAIALARQRLLTSVFPCYEIKGLKSHDPGQGFNYETAPHIKISDITGSTAVDLIHERYVPRLEAILKRANEALQSVDDTLRRVLKEKLQNKIDQEGKRSISDADERRWKLPQEGDSWNHWEMPFDVDADWPASLKNSVDKYRETWRAKQEEMNQAISENSEQEILYDQPELVKGMTRVSGPFTVEAVMPPEQSMHNESPIGGSPSSLESGFGGDGNKAENADSYLDTMTSLLRKDGVRFMNNEDVEFTRVERTTGQTYLHAEGIWETGGEEQRVAVSFGPEHGPITTRQVERALREAFPRGYNAIVFAGFSFDDAAQVSIQRMAGEMDLHLAHIRPDVVMEDLLYSPSKEQIFTVFGLPRTKLEETEDGEYQIEMEGVDVYDPVKGQINATSASKVAAWFIDTDYDGRTFCIAQAFFPKKKTWKKLSRALKGEINEDEFDKLTGTTSLPFTLGENECVAVKVIDPRGNEVMRIHDFS